MNSQLQNQEKEKLPPAPPTHRLTKSYNFDPKLEI